MPTHMTQSAYLTWQGQQCPCCASALVTWGTVWTVEVVAPHRATIRRSCSACGSHWHDRYSGTPWQPDTTCLGYEMTHCPHQPRDTRPTYHDGGATT